MIDGQTLLAPPVEAITDGLDARVPVLVGANSADGFASSQDKESLFSAFGRQADEARRLYDPDGQRSDLLVATAISADHLFIEPARAVARALAKRG